MSIEKLEEMVNSRGGYTFSVTFRIILDILKHQSDQIADLRQELAKKENAIDIGDVIKEARLRNG